jgi:hypothetical protein
VHLTEVAIGAAITMSVVGVSYLASSPDSSTQQAQTVADRADCRAVNAAIVAYVAEKNVAPHLITDVEPYVLGDISAYRIVGGLAAGPGCDPVTAH